MSASEVEKDVRCEISEAKGARSARRRAGFDAIFPRRTMRRPA